MKTHSVKTWLLYIAFIFSTGIMFVSCQKENAMFPDPSTLPPGLIGSWVEINTLSDTLIFNSDKDTGLVFLQRGYEIRNGYYLPVIGCDGYKYMISTDSIRLMGGLSSVWFDKTFYFKYDEANLTIDIGKFSEYIDTEKSNLTFRKIK